MSDQKFNAFREVGDIHPWIGSNTRNTKQLEKKGVEEGQLWDQRKNETNKAYSAFLLYLDLGPQDRSQTALAEILYGNPQSTGTIGKWSVEHDWLTRADAWDRFCMNSKITKMEKSVEESEDIMMAYLPKATMRLCKVAVGEEDVSRTQLRALTDFLDRIGPTKRRRAAALEIHNSLTISAPSLPDEVKGDISEIDDAEILEESADSLIPEKLREKRGRGH